MVGSMSSSAGVILEMARRHITQEALEVIMHSESEDGSLSSSEDSEAGTESSEVETDQLKSSSDSSEDSSEDESGGEIDETMAGWTSKS